MLKTAHDAEEFMRTGARVSPSWPGGDLRRIRCSRLISRRSRQNPLQTGRAIRFQHRVMGGSSSAQADRIGQDVEEETMISTILLDSISRWTRRMFAFSTGKVLSFARARWRRRQR